MAEVLTQHQLVEMHRPIDVFQCNQYLICNEGQCLWDKSVQVSLAAYVEDLFIIIGGREL